MYEDSGFTMCMHCGIDIPEYLFLDTIFCEECESPLSFGEPYCDACDTIYSDLYWRNLPIRSSIGAEFINLCCDKPASICKCKEVCIWEDAQEIPQEDLEEAYEWESPCSNCAYFYTAMCIPFRKWVLTYYDWNSASPGRIDICGDYTPWQEVKVNIAGIPPGVTTNV